MLLTIRRTAASDSTKCVQSKLLSPPILGWKLLLVHAQAGCIDHDIFVIYIHFIWTLFKTGAETWQTGTCPREKTLSSYERAGGKRRGKMLWLTKKNKKNKKQKRIIIKWKSKIESQNFKFEPATTFSTRFPNDAITLRIFVSILLPFWCISDYLFCRFVRSLALAGHRDLGHIGVSKWREEL